MGKSEGLSSFLADTAARHGVFRADELYARGFSRRQLQVLVRNGIVRREFHDVYALVGAQPTLLQGVRAGTLRAGPISAGGFGTASAYWTLGKEPPQIHIVTERRIVSDGRFRFHQVALPAEHIAEDEDVPVTTVPRTILDACSLLYPRASGRLLDRALSKQLTTLDELEAILGSEARQGRAGIKSLRTHIELRRQRGGFVRSGAEEDFLAFLVDNGFPAGTPNYLIDVGLPFPYEVDVGWPHYKIAAEIENYGTHGGFESFYRDKDKHNALLSAGWLIYYVTDELQRRPARMASELWELFRTRQAS